MEGVDGADCDRSPDEPPKTKTFQLGMASTAQAAWFHRGSPKPAATSLHVCVSVSNMMTSYTARNQLYSDGNAAVTLPSTVATTCGVLTLNWLCEFQPPYTRMDVSTTHAL